VAERLFGRQRPGHTLGEQQCSGFAGAADLVSTPLSPSPPLPSSAGKIKGPRADLALSQPPPGVARRQVGELRRATLLVGIGPPPEMRRTSSTAALSSSGGGGGWRGSARKDEEQGRVAATSGEAAGD
jgi:hypothetical protein